MIAHDDALTALQRGRLRLVQQGAMVAIVGLLSGFGLVFAILDAVHVWPFTLPFGGAIPGSEHGWRVAHVAGVMNGMLMILAGLALVHVQPTARAQAQLRRPPAGRIRAWLARLRTSHSDPQPPVRRRSALRFRYRADRYQA